MNIDSHAMAVLALKGHSCPLKTLLCSASSHACSEQYCVLQVIQDTAVKMGLTPEDDFILRVVQLSELLAIRHCVFLMGPTGSGRSECYKVLAKAIQTGSDKPMNTYLEATNRKKVGHVRMYA